MKKGSTFFLRGVLIIIGGIVLAICLIGLPYALMTNNLSYYIPIVVGLYVPAIPFFIALIESWKLLNYIDKNNAFSEAAVKALRNIKYCGITISSLFAIGMPYIFYAADRDDAPGVVAISLVIIFASAVIATFAGVLAKLLQNVVQIKSENELTV